MAQIASNSLERRILDLEASLRSLLAGAATAGTAVAASAPGEVTLTGVADTAGGVPWDVTRGPDLDVLVTAGRLRIDVGASFEVYGNKASLYVGYQVRGPAPSVEDLPTAPVVRAPSYEKSASLQHNGTGMNVLGAFSTFDLVTDLEHGWYRIQTAYALSYSGSASAPYGIATYRRLAATRY